MDIKDLRTLIKMVTTTDISEFEWEQGEERIVIRRGQVVAAAPAMAAPPVVMSAPAVPASAEPVAAVAPVESVEDGFETIESPIVGTFYRATVTRFGQLR